MAILMNTCKRTALGAAFWVAAAAALHAEVKMPAIFGDHMVLQESAKLPVWGTASPGEAVTITVGSETAHATADNSGKWRADLPPLAPNAAPVTMTVAGTNTLTFSDVLIGEVWICSGQSNMEFGIGVDSRGEEAIAKSNDPQLRMFMVPKTTALQPQADIAAAQGLPGKWQVCTPETLGGNWGWDGFSAAGYYFGRNIRQSTGKPVGLIGTYWGGTPAQAWTSLSGLQKDPELKHYVDAYDKNVAGLAQATADYPAKQAAYNATLAAWMVNGGKAFQDATNAWNAAAKKAAPGQPLPPRPTIATPKPRQPPTPDGGQNAPTNLFNGMLAPIIPFSIKGAIWYQGESNAGASEDYKILFSRMITDWREKWGEGDFPFLFVQLAAFKAGVTQNWPFLREAQADTLSLPATGMATAIDIGNPDDVHPTDKLDLGNRLALVGRHVAYGENVVYSGPVYASMQAKDNAISIAFTQIGGGLVISQAPWTAPGATPLPTDHLMGFTIAGADQKFVPAEAKIDGDSVVVSSPQVTAPAAVRYDWANAPQGNLYNKDGLPAFPFRTDAWTDPAAQGTLPPKPPTSPPTAK